MSEKPRGKDGKFIPARCPDFNCDGELVFEDGWWRCNGLTHDTPDGPLRECHHMIEGAQP